LPSSFHLVGSAGTLLLLLPTLVAPGATPSLLAGTLLPPRHHQLAPYCLTPLPGGTLLLLTLLCFPEDLYGYLSGATHPLWIRCGGGLGFSPRLFYSACA